MISAFGVEHGVSKSLVGGVFKPASKLTRVERGAVGGYKKARGVSKPDQEFKQVQAQTRAYHATAKPDRSFKSKSGTTHVYEHNMFSRAIPKGAAGLHIRVGGKKGTSHVHYRTTPEIGDTSSPKSTLKHEMSHAKPARSSYRMHQIIANPKKLMAEEGRADFEASGHFKRKQESGYAQVAAQRIQAQKTKGAEKAAKKTLRKIPFVGRRLGAVAANQVRAQTRPVREAHKSNLKQLSRTLNQPVGNKDIDAYIKTHDKMKRAKKRG